MAKIMQFKGEHGPVTLEVLDSSERGVRGAADSAIKRAETSFQTAIREVIGEQVSAFVKAIESLSNPPSTFDVKFGLKVNAEIGGFIVTKVGGEATFEITMSWNKANPA